MNVFKVKVWFTGDIGPASIEYTVIRAGMKRDQSETFRRLTNQAQKQFPKADKVRVELIEQSI